ncbi:MAG: replication protein P [Pseudohongiellaceae bacterium]
MRDIQKIDSLLAQANSDLKKSSSALPIAAGPSKRDQNLGEPGAGEYNAGTGNDDQDRNGAKMDHVDAINQMFAEFELAYHNQYRKAYADEASLILAKKYWLSCLSQFSPAQIVRAARHAVKTQEYLPSVAAVVKICETGLELFGLPTSRSAYLEACRATSPKAAWPWSHEAIYHAGKASDWYVLETEPESVAFPIFDYHYQHVCQRIMHGEKLDKEMPPPLPSHSMKKLSRPENRQRLRKLRDETGV